MTNHAVQSLHRSIYTGNDAALLATPTMGSSATTIQAKPLIDGGTLESGFDNDTHHPGQQALARIVEILDLMRPARQPASTGPNADDTSSYEDSVQAVSAFLNSLGPLERADRTGGPQVGDGAPADTATDDTVFDGYRQF